MRIVLTSALTGLAVGPAVLAGPALAAELAVAIEIPRLDVSEYHRPYVAAWLEGPGGAVTNLAVWYEQAKRDGEGTKWLKDMRTWWRKSGRELAMPVDGVSGATKAPGTHRLAFAGDAKPTAGLAPGAYTLVVEAAREVGGREVVRVPFAWPPTAPAGGQARGEAELGTVSLDLKP